MAELRWMLVTDGVSIDVRSNAVSLFSVFDNFIGSSFPFFFPRAVVVASIKRGPDEPSSMAFGFRVVANQHTLLSDDVTADFDGKTTTRVVLTLNGLIVPEPGTVKFQLWQGQKMLGEYVLDAKAATPSLFAASEPAPVFAPAPSTLQKAE